MTSLPADTQQKRGFTHESARNESVEWYTPPELFDALGVVMTPHE